MHRYLIVLFVMHLFCAHAQSVYVGPQLEAGTLQSSSTLSNKDNNQIGALQKNGPQVQWAAGMVLGAVLRKHDLSLSVSYRRQSLSYEDPNARAATLNAAQYIYSAQMSGLSAKIKYLFNAGSREGLDLLAGASVQSTFYKAINSTDEIKAPDNYTLAQYVRFDHNFMLNSISLGIAPELGIRYKLSKHIHLYLYGTYMIGASTFVKGNAQRVILTNNDRIDHGQYSSKGSSASVGLSMQYHITKNKEAAQGRLLAKEQKRRQQQQLDSLKQAEAQRRQDSLADSSTDGPEAKVVKYDSSGIPQTLDNRVIEKQNEVTVSGLEIELFVWDDKQEDGDSISLYLNGQWILEKYRIQNKKKSIKISLDPDRDNYLIMYALNEGRMPPNTCAVALDDGTGSRKLNLKSTMKSCAALHFKVKDKQQIKGE